MARVSSSCTQTTGPNRPKGAHNYEWADYCGARVCTECGDHATLERCWCGWSLTDPGKGRQELEDMGETIEPEL